MSNKVSRQHTKAVVRIIDLLIIFCLLLTSAGCTKPEEAEEDPLFMEQYEEEPSDMKQNEEIPSEAVEVQTSTERTSIKIFFPGYQPRNWSEAKAEIEKRTRDTLNITLDFIWTDQYAYISHVKTLQASNDYVDAFVLASPDGASPDFTKLAREGMLEDITDIFPQSAPALYKKYSNEELAYASVDSKLYAVPSLYTVADSPNIIIDDSLLKKYKINNITDFEQYEAFLKKVKENEPDTIPCVDTGTFINALPSVFGYAVADKPNMLVYKWDDPEMNLMAWETTPEFQDTVNMMIEWYQKGYQKAAPTRTNNIRAASVMIGSPMSPPSEKAQKVSLSNSAGIGTTFEFDSVRVCRIFPEKTIQRDNPMGKYYVNGSFVFPKASKNTEMVLRFLEWVQLDRNNYNLLLYGIEGKDHVIKDGRPQLPKGMNSVGSSYMYWGGHWAFKNLEYETAEKNVQPLMEYLKRNSEYPPHGVFYPEYGGLEQVAAQRAKTLQEFYTRISQGEVKTPEQLEKLINKMEDIGTDELIAMAQGQLKKN